MQTAEWEQRVAETWALLDELDEADFLARMELLAQELPPDDPAGLFERACSLDSTGHSDLALPLFEAALAAGATGERRRRSVIQMSSSLRNLGRSQESVALLTAELKQPSDHLEDAAKAVLALALTDVGREREAVPRYQRSMANYARLLVEPDPAADPESDVHD
jgi:tetratricopeptide (TPR) repeat protein